MRESSDSKNENRWLIIIAIASVLLIVGLWIGTYYSLKGKCLEERGTFGDMFGGINALFSGLAFAGIIITVLLQRKELALQRNELELTRKELKRGAVAQENSERALNRQAENLKISAKLSALNTLLNHYTQEEKRLADIGSMDSSREAYRKKKVMYAKRIEEILERKEDQ